MPIFLKCKTLIVILFCYNTDFVDAMDPKTNEVSLYFSFMMEE